MFMLLNIIPVPSPSKQQLYPFVVNTFTSCQNSHAKETSTNRNQMVCRESYKVAAGERMESGL
jgi:hypothetical protein